MTASVKRLEEVAQEMACRVRDEDPQAVRRFLHAALPNPDDRDNLIHVLSAAVPVDQSWQSLTAWAQPPPKQLQPCGTLAAARRHKARDETVCAPCREAERVYDRDRKRASRKAAA